MSNIYSLSKAQGFTRMDNEFFDAVLRTNWTKCEHKTLEAIYRHTIGFNRDSVRVSASYLAEMIPFRREEISRTIASLLRQRVLYRSGGSQGHIGVAPISEWVIDDRKAFPTKPKSVRKSTQCVTPESVRKSTQCVTPESVRKSTQCVEERTESVPKSTHKKDNIHTPIKRVVPFADQPIAEEPTQAAEKPKRKSPFGRTQILADNPHDLTDQLIDDWLALRDKKRAGVSKTVWTTTNAELGKCAAAGISANRAMAEAINAGWQGLKADWIINRLKGKSSRDDEYDSTSTAWIEEMCQ